MKNIKIILIIIALLMIVSLCWALYRFNFTENNNYIVNNKFVIPLHSNPSDKTNSTIVSKVITQNNYPQMTLNMKTWNWVNTIYNNGTEIKPIISGKFTLTFSKSKTFKATTDCNRIGGEYITSGDKISFSKMMSTLMYCDGSQEGSFTKMLNETQSYMFTSKGELVLLLKEDTGSVIFK